MNIRIARSLLGSYAAALFLLAVVPAKAIAQGPDEVRIGATVPITGRFSAEWGPGVRDFMRAWEKRVNADGGIFLQSSKRKVPIKFVIYDDESSPEKSVELYERLASVDKVHVFLGPGSSAITLRASTVAEQLKVPMLAVEANAPMIFARGYQWLVGVLKPLDYWSEAYFNLVSERRKRGEDLKSIAFVIAQDPHSSEVGKASMARAKAIGLDVVAVEQVPFVIQDFSAVVSKLKAAKPDIVYSAMFTASQVTFLKQSAGAGLQVKDMHVTHMVPELIKAAGSALTDGVSGESQMALKYVEPLFAQILKDLNVTDPYEFKSDVTPVRFLAMEVMKRALESASSLDGDAVMKSLRALKIETPAGAFEFSSNLKVGELVTNGYGTKPQYTMQVQDGKIRAVFPTEAADTTFKPTPWPRSR